MNAIDSYSTDIDLLEDYLVFLLVNESLPKHMKDIEFKKTLRALELITLELNKITINASAITKNQAILKTK